MTTPRHVDVIVIGAGLSGVGAGYRLQTECPSRTYAILEARDAIGGTWDLFRYPGVRSDSDVYTFGYSFAPWRGADSLADGAAIRDYVLETARTHGIDRRIHLGTRVVAARWSTADARWTVDTVVGPEGRAETWTCSFLFSCAGYYDYDRGHEPEFAGVEDFGGQVVHPQFWPGGLDVTGRRVVVIGSGATAMTLVPALAEPAAHVTMLQRSPTYVTARPRRDAVADGLRRILPARAAHRAIRAKNVLLTQGFYAFCRRWPGRARALLTRPLARELGPAYVRDHFTPTYNPWDQRLCVVPQGDLLQAIKRGAVSVVTDGIDRFVPDGVQLASGRVLEADVVVTATGLELKAIGGVRLEVDGEGVDLSMRMTYRGLMVTGVPNFAVALGYTNASWTLRSDLVSRYVCRFLNHLERHGLSYGVAVPDPGQERRPVLDLTSGYIRRSGHLFPSQGVRRPWTVRQNYVLDRHELLHADVTEAMSFGTSTVRGGAAV